MAKKKAYVGILLTLLSILAVISVGYYTFILFMTKVVPNLASFGIVLVAIVAGIATFFNPCSFPMVPVYLTRFFYVKDDSKNRMKVVYYGLIVSIGIITFNLLFGSLIGLLGENFAKSFALATENPNIYVLIFRGIIGTVLIFLGSMAILGRGLHFAIFDKVSRNFYSLEEKNPTKSFYVYGFGYNLIGIGCAGPILAILTVFAFASGGFFTALLAYFVFSLVMSGLMVFVSLLAGFAKTQFITKISRNVNKIRRISSFILVLVGLFLLLSSIFVKEFVGVLFPG